MLFSRSVKKTKSSRNVITAAFKACNTEGPCMATGPLPTPKKIERKLTRDFDQLSFYTPSVCDTESEMLLTENDEDIRNIVMEDLD